MEMINQIDRGVASAFLCGWQHQSVNPPDWDIYTTNGVVKIVKTNDV